MANTVVVGKNNFDIVCDGSTPWDVKDYFPHGICLHSVKFFGSAGDILVLRDYSATGTRICKFKDSAGTGTKDTFQSKSTDHNKIYRFPYLLPSDCTVSNWANLLIMIEFEE